MSLADEAMRRATMVSWDDRKTCQAAIKVLDIWHECGEIAVAEHTYICVHEHVKMKSVCRAHFPQPGIVGCRECLDAGHDCEMKFGDARRPG